MPGRPVKRRREMLKRMKVLGGWPWVFGQVADGVTLTKISETLGVSRQFLCQVMEQDPDGEGLEKELRRAKKVAAGALIEQGLEIVDTAGDENMAQVAKAKLRAEYRKSLAARWHPEEYGEKSGGVTIHVGSLHLDALRAQPERETLAYPVEPEGLPSGD